MVANLACTYGKDFLIRQCMEEAFLVLLRWWSRHSFLIYLVVVVMLFVVPFHCLGINAGTMVAVPYTLHAP